MIPSFAGIIFLEGNLSLFYNSCQVCVCIHTEFHYHQIMGDGLKELWTERSSQIIIAKRGTIQNQAKWLQRLR